MRTIRVGSLRRALRRELHPVVPTLRGLAPLDVVLVTSGRGLGVLARYSNVVGPDGARLQRHRVLAVMHDVIDSMLS